MNRANKKQRGIAMMLVLTVVVAASIMGMSYLSITSVRLASSTNMVCAAEATYLAESGLQHAMWMLRTDSLVQLLAATATHPLGPFQLDPEQLILQVVHPCSLLLTLHNPFLYGHGLLHLVVR